ncbi:MAG TPA: hypothetical protein VFK10_11740, partial [Burkholderiaceae bacterium]|nr:hypothetical protein [Burkholderiaceae bacterium]
MKLLWQTALLSAAAVCGAEPMNFDAYTIGQPPAGWSCGATGKGTPKWSVEADRELGHNMLKQSGRAPFPWCVKDDVALADGWVEVRFKPLSGREDQAGGVVWRWKDGDNYYVARANALENNVSLYHTSAGARRTILYKDAPVAGNVWHTLRVDFKGAHIRVALDGKTYIELDDTHILGSGKAGVWSKA